ncbi:muramidase [Ligilactobacillus pabuli]|uniref:Peptidoglycan hydrolase n=1 Tax=Ligilactobacillus pabuli TaxID=2886039 RepID=A0ABQ5JPI7_9LACO|nr:LysM peptidoglycan-binding domain-containing protein [Ligilactobacillus pabuli]GKS82271.1 muramidase [Ligilactobacillus pabuli]
MKKRKDRIEQEKALQFTEKFKSVKKATTYIGTTVLMGTAGVGLNRTKALADSTVQVENGQGDPNHNAQATATQQTAGTTQTPQAQNAKQAPTTQQTTPQATPSAQSTQVQGPAVQAQGSDENSLLRVAPTTFGSAEGFIAQIAQSAMQVAQQRGLYASMMIAQAGLESGWGGSLLSTQANNLFGVKWSGSGQYVEMPTNEYYGGQTHRVMAKFQRYSSYAESLNRYADLIQGHFPKSTLSAATVEQATVNLAHGVYGTYATDPGYAASLQRVINVYGLKQYDSKTSGSSTSTTLPNANSGQTSQPTQTSTGNNNANHAANGNYTVRKGDNLYRIAKNHGMKLQQLKELNHLTSDDLQVGQKLMVNGAGNSKPAQNTAKPSQPAKPAKPQVKGQTYKVKSKDSLWSISQKFQTTVPNLRKWNNLSSDIIFAEQTLVVSDKPATSTPSRPQQPSKPAAQPKPVGTSHATYQVQAGDTLWSIAHSHHLTVDQVKAFNHLNSNLINQGQKLVLGQSSGTVQNTPKPQAPAKKPAASTGTYTVKSGDSLWSIATAHQMSVGALKSANHLSADLITVGQKLKVNAATAPAKQSNQHKQPAHKAAKPQASAPTGSYVVKKSDSLWSIANAHNTTIAKLREWNHLTGSVIYIGQKLKVQGHVSVNTAAHKTTGKVSGQKTYTVQKQDSLWRIATRNQLTVNQLKALNHLVSDTIYVGQTLRLK